MTNTLTRRSALGPGSWLRVVRAASCQRVEEFFALAVWFGILLLML